MKHTQDRQQTALQLKLDELIRSTPAADDFLVQIERADEKELGERKHEQIAKHESLRSGESAVGHGGSSGFGEDADVDLQAEGGHGEGE